MADMSVGEMIGPLEVKAAAHGGHFVAHWQGRVVFVRHTLPGETVSARVTSVTSKIVRADAVDVLIAAADRVPVPCRIAGPGGCGGCDFQHIRPARQRQLKASVLAEQLRRLAGVTWSGQVEPVPGDQEGLGWRTRVRYQVRGERLGMFRHRSHDFVALPGAGCLLAVPELRETRAPGYGDGVLTLAVGEEDERHETVGDRTYRLTGDSFWQVHPGAAPALVGAVVAGLSPEAGETGLDLYCGAGLFTGALADLGVGMTGVDGSRRAVSLARENVPEAQFRYGDVARAFPRLRSRYDLVVLDPPRTGAGTDVMKSVLSLAPRAIAYVACDPAALARDVRTALAGGYELAGVRAFDLFPMTQHLEAVAILSR